MKTSKLKMINLMIVMIFFLCPSFITQIWAEPRRSAGETLYIPVYSKIQAADADEFYLTTFLTVRNLDLLHPITVESIIYHDTSGTAKRQFLKNSVVLNALSSYTLTVGGKDFGSSGMAGCYIVNWKAVQEVNAPLAEMVIGYARHGSNHSFVLQGVPIKD